MFHNYFKIALRQLVSNKTTSAINIAGLTVGMTCFILIALYVQYEMSFDTQHEKAERIYRVAQIQQGNVFRGIDRFAQTPRVLAPTLSADFPEVEAATTLQLQGMSLEKDGKVFTEVGLFSDGNLFNVFSFPIVEGNSSTSLNEGNSILLTKELAAKYFGIANPLGQTLLLQNKQLVTVAGIIEDLPENQHFTFDFIASYKHLPYYDDERWVSNNFLTYVALSEDKNPAEFEKKLTSLDTHLEGYEGLPFKVSYFLQPLRIIHLHSQINFEPGVNGDIKYVRLFSSIAFIILLLACINYTNLSTAKAAQRNKEVGVRKVLGAARKQLVFQFLAESFLLTFISLILATALASMVLPAFNQLLDKAIVFNLTTGSWLLAGMLTAAMLIGGLSGLYPAMVLSAASPVKAFRGFFNKQGKGAAAFRNALVVSQFAASIALAIGSVVIYQQLQFVQNKKPGYDRDGVVYIPFNNENITDETTTLRTELLKNPQISEVSFSKYLPLDMFSEGFVNQWEDNKNKEKLFIYNNYVDYHFIDLFGIKLKEGRNFSPQFPTDTATSYILNETAVKTLGWTSAIGKQFFDGKVIGVVEDFHFQSFNQPIKPLLLAYRSKDANPNLTTLSIRMKADEIDKTLAFVQSTAKTVLPHLPVQCNFMDDDWYSLYKSEQQLGQAFNLFTLLALFIACMGLFGLVSHQVGQRTKEIGIRKVLGATTAGLVGLLSEDFLALVIVSMVIASPLAYFFMEKWFQDYAYKIDIQLNVFVLVAIMVVAVAFLTVSFQCVKAALANPVKSLRNE